MQNKNMLSDRKIVSIAVILFIGLLRFGYLHFSKNKDSANRSSKNSQTKQHNNFNRHPQKIIYSKHARCRMECRHFTESEVREILENGQINNYKSQPNDKPCPSYAFEGKTSDGQEARMVFASCDNETVKVVTCIDLTHDYQCSCH